MKKILSVIVLIALSACSSIGGSRELTSTGSDFHDALMRDYRDLSIATQNQDAQNIYNQKLDVAANKADVVPENSQCKGMNSLRAPLLKVLAAPGLRYGMPGQLSRAVTSYDCWALTGDKTCYDNAKKSLTALQHPRFASVAFKGDSVKAFVPTSAVISAYKKHKSQIRLVGYGSADIAKQRINNVRKALVKAGAGGCCIATSISNTQGNKVEIFY